MLFLRSRVCGFIRLPSLLWDPFTLMKVFLWLWGLGRGDSPDTEPEPDTMVLFGPICSSLLPDSFSWLWTDGGPCVNSVFMASALEGGASFRWTWGLSRTPGDPEEPLQETSRLRGGSSLELVEPVIIWGPLTWPCSRIGLGDLLCREEPLNRGLDGADGENLMDDVLRLRLEFSVLLTCGLGLDMASPLTFLRGFGLSWVLWAPPVPLKPTDSDVRGYGTGTWVRGVWAGVVGVLLFWLLFSWMEFVELFFPFDKSGEDVWRGCLQNPDEDPFSVRVSCRLFTTLFNLTSLLLGKSSWLPFETAWGSAGRDAKNKQNKTLVHELSSWIKKEGTVVKTHINKQPIRALHLVYPAGFCHTSG